MALKDNWPDERVRNGERIELDEAARLRPNGWSSLEIQIVNVSRTGFRAQCDARLIPGSCVSIDVPHIGEVEAQVQWQRGGEFGARFFQPISLARCGWTTKNQEAFLARLLVQRAEARKSGLGDQEAVLRSRILSALPVRR